MVDWSEPSQEETYTGAGADRGQVGEAALNLDATFGLPTQTSSAEEEAGIRWGFGGRGSEGVWEEGGCHEPN